MPKPIPTATMKIFWAAIFIACELFRSIAPAVADYLGYTYNWQDDENMATYLKRVKTMITQ